MQRSTERIITTHAGGLPRSPELAQFGRAKDAGEPYDADAFAALLHDSVFAIVQKQAEVGLDVINDGEHGRSGFGYLRTRIAGLHATEPYRMGVATSRDYLAFTGAYDEKRVMLAARPSNAGRGPRGTRATACTEPVTYGGAQELNEELETLGAALQGVDAVEAFVTSLSPGNLQLQYRNDYYPSDDEYLRALADALHDEYQTIVDAGYVLQVDDPRLVTHWDRHPEIDLVACRRFMVEQIEVLNHALRGIPPERVRYHTCYSTNTAPRASDLELRDYVDLLLQINAGAYVIEAANPRHEHEWEIWERVKLPEGKVLIPGVVSHCVALVEHPELVAQRIVRFADVVGRENVIAGADCGFSAAADGDMPHPQVAWAKLQALVDGARLASAALW